VHSLGEVLVDLPALLVGRRVVPLAEPLVVLQAVLWVDLLEGTWGVLQVELMVAPRVVAQVAPLEETLEVRWVAPLVAPQVELMVDLMVALQAEREEDRRVVPLVVGT